MQSGFMKRLGAISSGLAACILMVEAAGAANVLKPVVLPAGEGAIVGAAFSPDSSRLALVRRVPVAGTPRPRDILQIVDIGSGKELAHADVLTAPSTWHTYIEYSPDGGYLLLAAEFTDVLSVVDATTLRSVKEIVLHPEARRDMAPGRYAKGVIGLASPSKGDVFGVLTHDEVRDSEVFVGSFSLGQILRRWTLGSGPVLTVFGAISLSFADDGVGLAVSARPYENSPPKGFNTLRLFNSMNGLMMKSIRTNGVIGPIELLGDNTVLAARIIAPGLFAKKACIEKWNMNSGNLEAQFCDQGRQVFGPLAAAPAVGRVVGIGFRISRDIEGGVSAEKGRVNVWDVTSGKILASTADFPLAPSVRISPNGEWILADQALLRFSAAP